MIFTFSLVIAALLCIASFICYKVSGKMLDEKDAEKCAKEAELEEKLIDLMMQTKSKPLSDDEFSFGGAYEALVMAGEHQTQMEDTENEIKALTDKIRLLSMVEQISYLMLSFGIMFACMLLFVTGIIAVGVLAANVYTK
mgnify:FL=1|jgi:hypothetical protein